MDVLGVVLKRLPNNSKTEPSLFTQSKQFLEQNAGQEFLRATEDFFSTHDMKWNNCISTCADGFSAMMGEDKGFAAVAYLGYGRHGTCRGRHIDGGAKSLGKN